MWDRDAVHVANDLGGGDIRPAIGDGSRRRKRFPRRAVLAFTELAACCDGLSMRHNPRTGERNDGCGWPRSQNRTLILAPVQDWRMGNLPSDVQD
jgi:hypothetical protein